MYQQAKARHPSYIESGVDRVWRAGVEDGTALSPVDLAVEAATPLHLAPLCWTGYDQTPSAMTVTNSGFTVMVNACFGGGGGAVAVAGEAPHLSRGPLRADYVFSQIHFHWGEHDRTGSGHAVKGVRYPLEMHVVHLKKDCANLKEALQSKDGIAVLVYLFALREERNAQLDQLTAILQFIRRARACARLHPTALAELVPPFTADYFLYWGAVGSPSGRYRILWMVSRRVLPVSGQQLREFRQLYDSQGNLLLSNSSKPHPLGDRTLFLVSPSEETRETVYGIVCGMTGRQEDMAYVDTSMDIRDAEYKSLRNLEEVANEHCRICPAQKRTHHVTRVNVDYPYRVNEGDTSVEESCVDLSNGTDEDQGVTVKTETKTEPGGRRVTNVTNVNVTTCRHHRAYTNRARPAPSEEVYAVVSARGSELHLRRRPVRQHERSVEQACMLLSATRSNSAPSLAATQEHTDLADRRQAIAKLSSEVAVHDRYSESEMERSPPRHRSAAEYDEFEHEMYEENVRSSKRARRVTVVGQGYQSQNDENPTNDRPVEIYGIGKSQTSIPHNKRFLHKQLDESDFNGYYKEDRKESEDKKRSQYFLVKQVQNKKPFYKVIGELPKSCNNSKKTAKKFPETTENYTAGRKDKTKKTEENVTVSTNRGQTVYSEFQQDISCDDKENRTAIRKQVIPNIPPTEMPESRKCGEETNNTTDYSESRKRQDRDPVINITTESDPHYKVSLLVRTTVSDHRKPGKKPIGSAQKYYVTKISPKDEPIFVTPKSSNSKVEKCDGKVNKEKYYYANPIVEMETTEIDVPNESSDYITNEAYMSEYEEAIEESHKQFRKEQYLKTTDQEAIHTENERKPTQTLKSDLNGRKPLQTQSVFNTNTYDRGGIADDKIVESHHEESADKHISQRYSSSEVNDVRKHSNLVERTNVYHGKNSPDEDVRVIDRIITGTVGKSDSTEVFVQGKHVEVVKPRKIDVSKEVNYNLVTSKHPEPQYYVKEPPNNSGPRAIVRQHLSLDQQVQGQSQVRQTVEYRRDRERQKASGHPVDGREISKSDRSDRNMTVATYEQSNHEQNSTTRKTQQIYKSMKQGETFDPTYVQNDYSEQDNVTMHNGKDKFIRQSVEDPKSTLPKTHTTDVTSSLHNVSRISSDMSQVTKVDIPKITDTYEDYKNMEHRVRDSRNAGMSSYEYEEETSSLSKKFESSKVRKKVQYVGEPLPNIPDRIKGNPVEQNQHNSHDILPLKQPDFVISDKRPRVSFQNDDNQNIYEDIEYEERTEEDSLYTSQRMEGKKITSHVKSKTPYKMPARTHPQLIAPSDDTLSIHKVEIPEPHYITRVPKQPLVEFEAYPVDPHEPFQIVSESQEMSSKGENQKTFMMFKRINGKAVLNQPSVIEPITIKSNRNEQSTNDQSVTEQARRSNQYSQDQFRNNQIRNEKSINEQDSLDRASNEQYRHDRSSYNKSRRDELTRSEDHYRHNKPINEVSKNEQPKSDQYVQGQLENDQSRIEERLRLSDSNTKSVIPINRSKTVPILSENAGNQVLIEEFNEENMAHDKQSRSVTRKQMRGSFPLEVNNKTPKTEIEKTHVEIDVQSNTPTTGKIEPQAVILRKPNIPLALPRDAERRRVLAEYEYSETSLLSQKKIIRKQKRYMYNVQQPPLFEEPTPSISKNNRQAIDDGFSNTTNERIRDREPQQEEEILVVPNQDESSEDRRLIQDTPSWNANEESDRGYKNTNQYIDQEYYESAINKNKTYKASKRQFEANQREMNPVPTLSGPSSFDHRPQDHRIVQDTSSRNQKNETTETDTDLNKPVPYQVVTANTSLDSRRVQDIIPTPNMNIKSDNAYQSPDIYINEEYYENSINKNRTYKSSRRQFETNQTADYNMAFAQTQPGPSHLMPFQPQDDSVQDTSSRDRNLQNDYAYGNANRLIDQHHHEISSDTNKYNSYGQSGSQSTETDLDSNKPDLSQGLAHPSQYRRVSQDVPSQNRNIESDSAYQNTNLYINQEYIESSTNKNKSYKSSTRQFTSNERAELDPRRSQLGPSQSIPPPSLGQNGHIFSNAEDLHDEDEPTKDNLTTSGRTMPLSNTTTARGGRVSNRKSQYGDQGRGQSLGTTAPSTKTDGDIVIYIRQPRVRKEHVVPKITVDVTDKHKVSPSQINQQTVKIQEIKPKRTNKGKRRITVRKSKSENIYRQSNSSDSSSDENMETSLQTESNEEQVLDTTHYNLTLKSQTTVDISKSDKANVKSTAEVRITPLNSTPKIELEESCSDAKMIMTQARETTSYETSSADACDGRQAYQSPIKIDSATAQTRQYPRLCFHNHWDADGEALLENNGKTLRASLAADNSLDDEDEDAWPCVEGGPLVGRYNFVELHFHWGWKDCCGAEHVIDGERHALEAHFLYVKKEYKSLETGMRHADGLATVAVKFDVGGPPHSGLGRLLADVRLIREADTGVYVAARALFTWLRPTVDSGCGYFCYKGTLTKNPPCVDCVTWLVFPQPIVFCCQQSSEFRKLKSSTGEELRKNFRTPQPLNNRPVYYVPLPLP